jgi:metal-responsive CopG/Arc/MetJ family transcriptional regulator
LNNIDNVETVQIVLEKELLRAADRAARRHRINRSALLREALREHLKRLAAAEREKRDREGYEARPVRRGEFNVWNKAAAWPDE